MKQGTSTIYTVAEFANVSVATVSRYLNRTSEISVDNYHKIEQAIAALEFVPKCHPSKTRSLDFPTIGLVIPNIEDFGYSDLVNGMDQCVQNSRYRLNIQTTGGSACLEKQAVSTLDELGAEIIICVSVKTDPDTLKSLVHHARLIPLEREAHLTCELFDCYSKGLHRVIEYLVGSGFTRLVYVEDNLPSLFSQKKERLVSVCREFESITLDIISVTEASLFLQINRNHKLALLAANDLAARKVLNGIHAEKLSVPDLVSLVCINEFDTAEMMHPSITHLSLPFYQLGQRSMGYVLGLHKKKDCRNKNVIAALIVGDTRK